MTVILRAAGSQLTPTAWGILTLAHSTRLQSRSTITTSTDGGEAIVSARSAPLTSKTHALEVLYKTRTEAEAVLETVLRLGVPVEYIDTKRPLRITRAVITGDTSIEDEPGRRAVRLSLTLQEVNR